VEVNLIASDMDFADLVDHLRAGWLHLVADLGRGRSLRRDGFLPWLGHDSDSIAEEGLAAPGCGKTPNPGLKDDRMSRDDEMTMRHHPPVRSQWSTQRTFALRWVTNAAGA
jgi:hypothetical protein